MQARNVFEELKARGFVYQCTDEEGISKALSGGSIAFYAGFDPTGDSLHVGHLLPVMAMRRLQRAGHKPIVLIGGATALIGDPSGKQEARPILSKEKVAENAASIKAQLSRYISADDALFVNNSDWFKDLLYIDFLRDVGSKFSVNRMLSAESVKMRLKQDSGISFLEFNYMILQAYDFQILNSKYSCKLQIGGQDQWGNIVSGTELIRRNSNSESAAFGLTIPLLMNSQGQKFGKTVAGAVWLDPARTSVFDFYQFWRNADDADVPKLLRYFTNLPLEEIDSLTAPGSNVNRAKEILAYEATALAHGSDEAAKQFLAAGAKFGFADKDGKVATSSAIKHVSQSVSASAFDDLPSYTLDAIPAEGLWIVKLLADSGLCKSNGDARRLIQGGGAYLDDVKISDLDLKLHAKDFPDGSAILKAGKKNLRRILLA
jgi:tyrosyl-tRNA synthetase